MHTQHGFSLIELVVSLVIVVLIGGYIVFANWPGATLSLQAQAEQFASDIRLAQALSMTQGDRYQISISFSGTSYKLIDSTASTNMIFQTGSVLANLYSGISFGSLADLPNNLIEFDGQGMPYLTQGSLSPMSASVTIPLTTSTDTKNIIVTPYTGRVIIQ